MSYEVSPPLQKTYYSSHTTQMYCCCLWVEEGAGVASPPDGAGVASPPEGIGVARPPEDWQGVGATEGMSAGRKVYDLALPIDT